MKVTVTVSVALFIAAVVFFVYRMNLPPTDSSLIANFYAHRAAYERLKLYLQADDQLNRLASWGVQTKTSPSGFMPPLADFSRERFDEYWLLLKEVHGVDASRSHGPHSELCVGMWGAGFAGSTEHINVCWLEDMVPGKQVLSIDNVKRDADSSTGQRQFFYRKIEGNWYLERDG